MQNRLQFDKKYLVRANPQWIQSSDDRIHLTIELYNDKTHSKIF